jgi:hypothetical protein
MSAIEDVQFGPEIGPGRPSVHAFETFPGDVDRPRSRSASIDALKALNTPRETSNEQRPAMQSVTGNPDDTTRTAIQGQAFIAESRQAELTKHSVTAERSQQPGIFVGSSARPSPEVAPQPSANADVRRPNQPDMARVPTALPQASASRSDPRHPNSPNHALYSELQRRIPDASEDRLVQFIAACHRHRITARNLSEIDLDEDRMTLSFESDDPSATPATIDLNLPPPAPEQAIQQIQQVDQQMDQIVEQSRQRSAHTARQGLVM